MTHHPTTSITIPQRPAHATAVAAYLAAVLVVIPVRLDAQGSGGRAGGDRSGAPAARVAFVGARTSAPPAATGTPRTVAELIDAAIREYRAGGPARTVTAGSLVAFPFGHAEPVLTCSVLRACVVELEPGELLVNDPIAGDQARWLISQARTGPEGASALVVVKPKDCNLTTNLVISTDRRIYDLDLDSPRCAGGSAASISAIGSASSGSSTNPRLAYLRHVRFYYPDDDGNGRARGAPGRAATDAGSDVGRGAVARGDSVPALSSARALNRDYRVRRARRGPFGLFGRKPLDFPWAPAAIHDDGVHVYIQLPAEARHHAAPVLYALEDDGSRTLVNYAARDGGYATDRTFRRGVLVLASGGRERRLEFENRAWGRAAGVRGKR